MSCHFDLSNQEIKLKQELKRRVITDFTPEIHKTPTLYMKLVDFPVVLSGTDEIYCIFASVSIKHVSAACHVSNSLCVLPF